MEVFKHGFTTSSVIITETQPGGGPPLHARSTEEVHLLLDGRMRYVVGEQRFEASGPYIVNIPAETPHAFINAGDVPLRLICFFPNPEVLAAQWRVGPNPLLVDTTE